MKIYEPQRHQEYNLLIILHFFPLCPAAFVVHFVCLYSTATIKVLQGRFNGVEHEPILQDRFAGFPADTLYGCAPVIFKMIVVGRINFKLCHGYTLPELTPVINRSAELIYTEYGSADRTSFQVAAVVIDRGPEDGLTI